MRMYTVKAKMSKDDDWYVLKVCIGVKDKALNEATEIKERAKKYWRYVCIFESTVVRDLPYRRGREA